MESMQQQTSSPAPPIHPQHPPTPPPNMSAHPTADFDHRQNIAAGTVTHSTLLNSMHDATTSSVAYQQQQQQLYYHQEQQQQQQQQLIAAAEDVKLSQQQQIQQLQQQLQNAQQASQEIAAENERLMELSSALRSERDRAVLAQSNAVGVATGQPQQLQSRQAPPQQLDVAASSQPQQMQVAYVGNHQQVPITLPPAPTPPPQAAAYPQQECYLGYAYPVLQQQQQYVQPPQQYVQPHQQHQQPGQQSHASTLQDHEALWQGKMMQQPSGQTCKAPGQLQKPLPQGCPPEDAMSSEVRLQALELMIIVFISCLT